MLVTTIKTIGAKTIGRQLAIGALLATSAVTQAAEIVVHYDVGWGNNISIRGNAATLSWSSGQTASYGTEAGQSVWRFSVPASAGTFEFKPLINDQTWSFGDNYKVTSANQTIHVYPTFASGAPTAGNITRIPDQYSAILNYHHTVDVYLPPSYSYRAQTDYPVIYMLDGQNLFNTGWNVNTTLDGMINNGEVREAIVVGIHNKGFGRMKEYTPTYDATYGDGGDGDLFLDYIEQELMPEINQRFRTQTGPSNTFMMGSSLGGLMSFYAGWTRSNVYGKIGALSSSFFWDNDFMLNQVRNYNGPKINTTLYIDTGEYEIANGAGDTTMEMQSILNSKGYSHYHWLARAPIDRHNEYSWGARVHLPLSVLLAF